MPHPLLIARLAGLDGYYFEDLPCRCEPGSRSAILKELTDVTNRTHFCVCGSNWTGVSTSGGMLNASWAWREGSTRARRWPGRIRAKPRPRNRRSQALFSCSEQATRAAFLRNIVSCSVSSQTSRRNTASGRLHSIMPHPCLERKRPSYSFIGMTRLTSKVRRSS